MAEFGRKFSDDAELSGARLQYKVVCLGFVFDLLCRFLPSWVGRNSTERVVMGGLYGQYPVMQAGWKFVTCFPVHLSLEGEECFLRTHVLLVLPPGGQTCWHW